MAAILSQSVSARATATESACIATSFAPISPTDYEGERPLRHSRTSLVAFCLVAAATFPGFSRAQDAVTPAVDTMVAPSSLSTPQYDELVAPVALYPDSLLADVLAASTYPLEVVDAERWASDSANASLAGDDLASALDAEPWDPSVKSLVAVPDVLAMLDSHLDWTVELGQSFLADPDAVLAAVQRMRARAAASGNLSSDAEQTVTDTDNEIAISPPPSGDLYVPQYDPWCAFGNWPYSVPAPYFFEPWPGYCEPAQYSVLFSTAIVLPFGYWGWGYFNWRRRELLVRPDYYHHFHPASEPKTNVWYHDAKQDRIAASRISGSARALVMPKAMHQLRAGEEINRAVHPAMAFQRFASPRIGQMTPQRRLPVIRPALRTAAHAYAPAAHAFAPAAPHGAPPPFRH